jgi:cell wall-associated NlpC family hydrolase
VIAVVGLAGSAFAVPPPPPNPSDNDLSSSQQNAHRSASDVGKITSQLTDAQGQLDTLQSQVELKMELANKAMVDMQTAQGAAAKAAKSAQSAKAQADSAGQQIAKARKDLDEFASGSYQQGSTVGSVSAYLGAKNPNDFLERAQLLNAVGGTKLKALDNMQRVRTQKANLDSSARAALQDAQQKQAAAETAKTTADTAKATAVTARQSQKAQTDQIAARKKDLEAKLNAAQSKLGGLTAQRAQYDKWLANKQAEDEAKAAADRAAADRQQASSSSGGGSSGGGGSPSVSPASGSSVQTVIARAKSALGIRYSWGGGNQQGPTVGVRDGGVADSYGDYYSVGFDCSGLMIYAFGGVGISLGHYTGYQYDSGPHVPISQIQPGDMVFYATNGNIHHVALYIGNGNMIEAPQSGMVVRITPLRYGELMPYAVRML